MAEVLLGGEENSGFSPHVCVHVATEQVPRAGARDLVSFEVFIALWPQAHSDLICRLFYSFGFLR